MKINHVVVLFTLFLLGACSSSSVLPISSASSDGLESNSSVDDAAPTNDFPMATIVEVHETPEPLSLTTCESNYRLFDIKYTDPILPLDYPELDDFTSLSEYSEMDANSLINFIKAYPQSLDYTDRGYHNSSYFSSFHYVKLIQEDTLFRFPGSRLATEWKWDRAFSMFMSDDNEVYDIYSSLLLEGLNKESLAPDELSCWFIDHESRLELKLFPIGNEQNIFNISYLAQISDSREVAGLFFFITQDGDDYQARPLVFDQYTRISSATGIDFAVLDFTGDNTPEIVTSHAYFPGSGDAITTFFNVFEISSGTPTSLEFDPPIGTRRERTWKLIESDNDRPKFRITMTYDRMSCPFTETWVYQWDGERIRLLDYELPTKDQILQHGGTQCLDIFLSGMLGKLHSGDLSVLDTLIEYSEEWPYSDSGWFPYEEGGPREPNYMKFVMAIYLLNLGEYQQANDLLNLILSKPSISSEEMSALASEFLNVSTREEFIDACIYTDVCYRLLDLDEDFIRNISSDVVPDVVSFFRDIGAPVELRGVVDVNNDGIGEEWMVLEGEENLAYYVIWVVIESNGSYMRDEIYANLGENSFDLPPNISPGPYYLGYPSLIVSDSDDSEIFVFDENGDGEFLLYLCNQIYPRIDKIEEMLYEGDPTELLEKLEELYLPMTRGCDEYQLRWLMPNWLYLSGILNELLATEDLAIQAYTEILREFPDSPYALLAAGRLGIIP